jgi:hypothetical protein
VKVIDQQISSRDRLFFDADEGQLACLRHSMSARSVWESPAGNSMHLGRYRVF